MIPGLGGTRLDRPSMTVAKAPSKACGCLIFSPKVGSAHVCFAAPHFAPRPNSRSATRLLHVVLKEENLKRRG